MKKLIQNTVLILFLAGTLSVNCFAQSSDVYDGIEFDMPVVEEPKFTNYQVSILDFGAVGDGLVDNSKAFEQAMAHTAEKGGGTIVVPRGVWSTGPIVFRSHINLHVERGALIVFSEDKSKYPLIGTSFEGLETYRCQSPIYGKDLENIAITGAGIIDGSGGVWRPVKKVKMSEIQWKALLKSGGVVSADGRIWYPSKAYEQANKLTANFNVPPFKTREEFEAIKDFLRPVMVSFVNCQKVLLDGPTFQNSPAWNIHPLLCEDVTIRNLTIRNPWFSQNGDGLDVESCKNVVVLNNTFDVGDDAICIKSGKDEDGRKRGVPTENVIIKNNVVYHGHGGFVVGSEMSGGVRNVHVSNCTFIGTDIGLRFKSTRGRGGVVENIYISNIDMINIPAEAIRFNLFYGGKSPIPEDGESADQNMESPHVPVTEETPAFKNIFMHHITATGSGTAAFMQGLPEMKLHNIVLEDAVLEATNGVTMVDADGIVFKNVLIDQKKGEALTIYNSSNIDLNQVHVKNENEKALRILGSKSNQIRLNHSSIKSDQIQLGSSVQSDVIKIN